MPSTAPTPVCPTAVCGVERAVRAGLVGAVAVVMAAIGHWLGGGAWAPLAVMVPVALVVSALAWWSSGTRHRTVVMALLLLGTQAAVHLLVCYLHGHLMMPSLGMATTHLLGSVAAGVLLHRVDALWWALLAPLVALVRLVLPDTDAPVRPHGWATPLVLRPVALTWSLPRRGPPIS